MKLIWSEESWDDYLYWQETDKRIVKKINELIKDTRRTPFEGKGKPEPLKHNLSGFWSRRITEVKWHIEFGHLNRGDMLTSEQHRCSNEKKKFQRRV